MVADTECRAKGEALQKSNRCAISTQGKDISKIFSSTKYLVGFLPELEKTRSDFWKSIARITVVGGK